MKKHPFIMCLLIIAVCFLYTGSAYMSESYRLITLFDEQSADIITSVSFYLLQAAGIAVFIFGFRKRPEVLGDRRLFAVLTATGAVFMAASLLAPGTASLVCGYIFNLHIGFYFGYYITLLGRYISPSQTGLCFGAAYAAGSIGTYLFSLIGDGSFMVSGEITAIYLVLAGIVTALVLMSDNIMPDIIKDKRHTGSNEDLRYLVPVIIIITVVFTVGSGLFYSMPVAETVNWNLIRTFYAAGLITAGIIMDRKRLIGEILVMASITYPLIVSALSGAGVTGTALLSVSYLLRGFVTIYYITAFTDIANEKPSLLYLAPLGLLLSRVSEALISWPLLTADIPYIYQLIFSAACFIPLLALFISMQSRKSGAFMMPESRRYALFSEKHALTARETEILKCIVSNMSDGEIASEYHISRNTVRFHISNLLKKTGTSSRVEAVRAFEKYI